MKSKKGWNKPSLCEAIRCNHLHFKPWQRDNIDCKEVIKKARFHVQFNLFHTKNRKSKHVWTVIDPRYILCNLEHSKSLYIWLIRLDTRTVNFLTKKFPFKRNIWNSTYKKQLNVTEKTQNILVLDKNILKVLRTLCWQILHLFSFSSEFSFEKKLCVYIQVTEEVNLVIILLWSALQ